MKLSALEIANAVGGRLITKDNDISITHIATDTSKVTEGTLFVPIIGARVDGHSFIEKAFENGAKAVFTSKVLPQEIIDRADSIDKAIISVRDTKAALQDLGRYYRLRYIHIPYIGVTGSVGKTTTREMIACALSASLNTYSTRGNANSQVGVPITVAETPEDAEAGVIEMGISEHGEMNLLSRIVNCSMAVVTVIGVSHIANLGSRENIMKEKLHITDHMPDGAVLLLNGDDELLNKLSSERLHEMGYCAGRDVRLKFYGTGANACYRAENIEKTDLGTAYDFYVNEKRLTRVKLFVPGRHMLLNSLAALAAAVENKADIKKAAERLSDFKSLDGRGRISERDGIKIINDAYNAAPQSMAAGLKVLDETEPGEGGERIAVLADMLELGRDEKKYHEELGSFIVNETENIDRVLLYGELTKNTISEITRLQRQEKKRPRADHFDSIEALRKELYSIKKKGDIIFFKGSNSMRLWELAGELSGE